MIAMTGKLALSVVIASLIGAQKEGVVLKAIDEAHAGFVHLVPDVLICKSCLAVDARSHLSIYGYGGDGKFLGFIRRNNAPFRQQPRLICEIGNDLLGLYAESLSIISAKGGDCGTQESWRLAEVRKYECRASSANKFLRLKFAQQYIGALNGEGLFHFIQRSAENAPLGDADAGNYGSENSHPNSSNGRSPSSFIWPALLLLVGAALVKVAFYIADDPLPPRWLIVVVLAVGGIGFVAIIHGTFLLLS